MKEPILFEVHYHGTPVLVGKHYNPGDLHAHLILSDKEFLDVRSVDYEVDGSDITHTGQNIFKATYHWNGKTFIDYFGVYGYTNKRYIDKDFQVFSIENSQEEDVTEQYRQLFYNEFLDKIYITINNLDKHLSNGIFRFILPQDTGLYHQYATEWIVKKDESGIKTNLFKVYNEEEYRG